MNEKFWRWSWYSVSFQCRIIIDLPASEVWQCNRMCNQVILHEIHLHSRQIMLRGVPRGATWVLNFPYSRFRWFLEQLPNWGLHMGFDPCCPLAQKEKKKKKKTICGNPYHDPPILWSTPKVSYLLNLYSATLLYDQSMSRVTLGQRTRKCVFFFNVTRGPPEAVFHNVVTCRWPG